MDLKINGYGQSFGGFIQAQQGKIAGLTQEVATKMAEALKDTKSDVILRDGKVLVHDVFNGHVYSVLPYRPEYMPYSRKTMIQYPVKINGIDTVYNVQYKTPQNHMNRIGGEIEQKKGIELQLLSAREIALDIDRKF